MHHDYPSRLVEVLTYLTAGPTAARGGVKVREASCRQAPVTGTGGSELLGQGRRIDAKSLLDHTKRGCRQPPPPGPASVPPQMSVSVLVKMWAPGTVLQGR
jgi:hypothetical protein